MLNPFWLGRTAPPPGPPMVRDVEGPLVCRLAPPEPPLPLAQEPLGDQAPNTRDHPHGMEPLVSSRRAGPRLLAQETPPCSAHSARLRPGLPCVLLALCGRWRHPPPGALRAEEPASSAAWFLVPMGFVTAHPTRTLSGTPVGLMTSLVGAGARGRGRGSFQHPTPLSPVA